MILHLGPAHPLCSKIILKLWKMAQITLGTSINKISQAKEDGWSLFIKHLVHALPGV